MSYAETFGTIIHPRQVGAWVREHLQEWMPDYLAKMEDETGRDPRSLPMIRSWQLAADIERWPEDQLPAVVVVVPGTADIPTLDGAGNYRAEFTVAVGLFVSANTEEATEDLASVYTAAVLGAITQHESIGNHFEGARWRGFEFDAGGIGDSRTLGITRVEFVVTVGDVINIHLGPLEPSEDPYEAPGACPTAETVDIALSQTAIS